PITLRTPKDITLPYITLFQSNITSNAISLVLPYGTDPSSLTPTIVHTGASVSPTSGASADFTNPVTYTVTAADNSTKDYTVTVQVARESVKDIAAFEVAGVPGTVNANTIDVTVPYGTDVTT